MKHPSKLVEDDIGHEVNKLLQVKFCCFFYHIDYQIQIHSIFTLTPSASEAGSWNPWTCKKKAHITFLAPACLYLDGTQLVSLSQTVQSHKGIRTQCCVSTGGIHGELEPVG